MQLAPRHLPALLLVVAALSSQIACSRDEGGKGSKGSAGNATTGTAKLKVAVEAITACPEGARLDGEAPSEGAAAPPSGFRQRCQKDETTRHGASREWYVDGRERAYSEWWEGEKHGRFRLWFENGQLRAEGAHRFGFPAGQWKYYGKDGKLMQDRTFEVAAPAEDWIAQAIAGKLPVRDVPQRTGGAASEMTGAGAIESPLADGLPPLKAAPPEAGAGSAAAPVVAPGPGTVKREPGAGQPHAPAPADPVFTRGGQGGN